MATNQFPGRSLGTAPRDRLLPADNVPLRRTPFYMVHFRDQFGLEPKYDPKTRKHVEVRTADDLVWAPTLSQVYHTPGAGGFAQGAPGTGEVDTTKADEAIRKSRGIILPDDIVTSMGPLSVFGKLLNLRRLTLVRDCQDKGAPYYATPWIAVLHEGGEDIRIVHDRCGWQGFRLALVTQGIIPGPSPKVYEEHRARAEDRIARWRKRPVTEYALEQLARARMQFDMLNTVLAAEDVGPVEIDASETDFELSEEEIRRMGSPEGN